jgi:hypothetical protein
LNFCPKQVNEWIGGPRASLFQLFIAFLTWPNLTCLNRPLSQFFHYLTPPVHTYWLPHRGGGASTNFWKNDFWKNDLVPFILGIQLNDKFYYNWLDCCNCFNLNWNANANHQSNSNWLKRFEINFKW